MEPLLGISSRYAARVPKKDGRNSPAVVCPRVMCRGRSFAGLGLDREKLRKRKVEISKSQYHDQTFARWLGSSIQIFLYAWLFGMNPSQNLVCMNDYDGRLT